MANKEFEDWLIRNGRSVKTVLRHRTNLSVLLRELPDWSIKSIDSFLVTLKINGRRHATLNSYVDTIRLYGDCFGIPELRTVKHFKEQAANRGILSDAEIEALCNLPPPFRTNKPMWQLFSTYFWTLALTGCRPHEIADMKPCNIDLGRGCFNITHTKTGALRPSPIPPQVFDKIKSLCDRVKPNDYIFVTSKGRKFEDSAWSHAFEKRKKLLGINRSNITLYSLRHSFCNTLLEEGVNTHVVAKTMGHRIEETATYEHLTFKDIKKAVSRHPLIKKQGSKNPQDVLNELEEVPKSYDLTYITSKTGNSVTIKVYLK